MSVHINNIRNPIVRHDQVPENMKLRLEQVVQELYPQESLPKVLRDEAIAGFATGVIGQSMSLAASISGGGMLTQRRKTMSLRERLSGPFDHNVVLASHNRRDPSISRGQPPGTPLNGLEDTYVKCMISCDRIDEEFMKFLCYVACWWRFG